MPMLPAVARTSRKQNLRRCISTGTNGHLGDVLRLLIRTALTAVIFKVLRTFFQAALKMDRVSLKCKAIYTPEGGFKFAFTAAWAMF